MIQFLPGPRAPGLTELFATLGGNAFAGGMFRGIATSAVAFLAVAAYAVPAPRFAARTVTLVAVPVLVLGGGVAYARAATEADFLMTWMVFLEPSTGYATVLRCYRAVHRWLLVSSIRHEDNQPITAADERWLRWPATQLEYAFRRVIDDDKLYPPVAGTNAAPRTG
ncbi:hypothetical protein [Actinoplanes sp. NPDC051494]|uniref:hypothetical protein n=1 Tax=Actinoplanes sp. NPDC051494 TaxID=3363907 RepID=UPI0037A94124